MNLEFTQPIKCYNGAYDSATQRVMDAQARALKAIQKHEPDAHVTHFPGDGTWVVHVWGREISSYHQTKGAALHDALRRFQ